MMRLQKISLPYIRNKFLAFQSLLIPFLFLIQNMVFVFSLGCNKEFIYQAEAKGSLLVVVKTDNFERSAIAKSAETGIDMTINSYSIMLDGPDKESKTVKTDYHGVIEINNLAAGEWQVNAIAKNSSDEEIASGIEKVTIVQDQRTDCEVDISAYENWGSVDFTVSWNIDLAPTGEVAGRIESINNSITPIEFSLDQDVNSYTNSYIPSGYYRFSAMMTMNNSNVGGSAGIFQVFNNESTGINVFLNLINSEENSGTVITPSLENPIEISFLDCEDSINEGESFTVSAVFDELLDVEYFWYLDGVIFDDSQGNVFIVPENLAAGNHQVDLVVVSSDGSRAGSYSHNFLVESPESPFTVNLRTTNVASSEITLVWDADVNYNSSYVIERARDQATVFAEIVTILPADGVYVDRGLENDTTFYYRLKTVNASNSTVYSNIVTARTINNEANIDKWGGFTGIKNPSSKYQLGTATSVTRFTLIDDSKSWGVNDLKGCILQPNTSAEVYYLIKENSADTITIYGSDVSGHEEELYRFIDEDNNGSEEYAVLDRWAVKKVNNRWLLFDPYGNSFFIKSINGYNYEYNRYGYDHDGNSFSQNLSARYGTNGDQNYAAQIAIDDIKRIGFNTWGEVVDVYRIAPGGPIASTGKDPSRFMPFIAQVRISSLNLNGTSGTNWGIDAFTSTGVRVWDATDTDFQDAVEDHLTSDTGARTDGISQFNNRTYWNWIFLTPYRYAKYNLPANPWYIGLDWDEEPAYLRSEQDSQHMGYHILVSAGNTGRKIQAVEFLRNKYGNIGNLNSSWGSNFADWTALQNDTGSVINGLLSTEPYCRDYGSYNEANSSMKADLDDIAEDFWRIYVKKVHDALDNVTAVHMINFGPGYHGWTGSSRDDWRGCTSREYLFRAAVSSNRSEHYIDIIGVGDPLHGMHESPTGDMLINMRSALKERYAFHGRPYWHESCWITAEADSGLTFEGSIDSLSSTVLGDAGVNFQTDNGFTNALVGSGGAWVLPDSTVLQENRIYYRIAANSCANGSLSVDVAIGPGNNWSWDSTPDFLSSASIGDRYVILQTDTLGHVSGGSNFDVFIPLTQEDRALMYVRFLDDLVHLQADNGDYIDVGYSHWEFYDYGFRDSSYHEFRNWGFASVKANFYDGVEATIANGEIQDCGNFVGPVSEKLLSIYNDMVGH